MGVKKLILIGGGGVGKTAFVSKLLRDEFTTNYCATIGVQVNPYQLGDGNTFNIWDLAGQEKFGGLRDGYYIGGDCCILMFESGMNISFAEIKKFQSDVARVISNKNFAVICNKTDAKENNLRVATESYCSTRFFPYFEISVKDSSSSALKEIMSTLYTKWFGGQDSVSSVTSSFGSLAVTPNNTVSNTFVDTSNSNGRFGSGGFGSTTPSFTFGSGFGSSAVTSPTTHTFGSGFTLTANPPAGGANPTPFTFGGPPVATPTTHTFGSGFTLTANPPAGGATPTPFTFGGPPTATPTSFTFGGSPAATPTSFTFGGGPPVSPPGFLGFGRAKPCPKYKPPTPCRPQLRRRERAKGVKETEIHKFVQHNDKEIAGFVTQKISISAKAMKILVNIANDHIDQIFQTSKETLLKATKGKTLNDKILFTSCKLIYPRHLLKNMVMNSKVLSPFESKLLPVMEQLPSSLRDELTFISMASIKSQLSGQIPSNIRVAKKYYLGLIEVIQYLIYAVLKIAKVVTLEEKKLRITPDIFIKSVLKSEDLYNLFKEASFANLNLSLNKNLFH